MGLPFFFQDGCPIITLRSKGWFYLRVLINEMNAIQTDNREIAEVLNRVADLLEAQDANHFRVRAYRNAARTVEQSEKSISRMAIRDQKSLEELPDIGQSIAGAIREFVHTGRLGLLDRLEGQVSPEALFTAIPGIGEELAQRIYSVLEIETLEALELAAHDGRLIEVPGIGERRVKGIRDSLNALLSRSTRRRARRLRQREQGEELIKESPDVDTILQVDTEYRQRAAAGELKTIAPRRFNPKGEAWLPIYHTEKSGWNFTALFSNSARAHELEKTHDWVVVYFEKNGHENQCTVVTEYKGPLSGKRVIRGREKECLEFYRRS